MTRDHKRLALLYQFKELGIDNQIDYDKFYLYSLITHSTAIEGSTVTEIENQLLFDEGMASRVDVSINIGINEQRVLELIRANNRITAKEVADSLLVSLRQNERTMATLKDKDLIIRIGSNKSGHWENTLTVLKTFSQTTTTIR